MLFFGGLVRECSAFRTTDETLFCIHQQVQRIVSMNVRTLFRDQPGASADSRRGGRRGARALRIVPAVGGVLLCVAVLASLAIYRPRIFLPVLQDIARRQGYQLEIEDVHVSMRPFQVKLGPWSLEPLGGTARANLSKVPEGKVSFRSEGVVCVLDVRAVFSGKPWIRLLEVENPQLEVRSSGHRNEAPGFERLKEWEEFLSRVGQLGVRGGFARVATPEWAVTASSLEAVMVPGGAEDARVLDFNVGLYARRHPERAVGSMGSETMEFEARIFGRAERLPAGAVTASVEIASGRLEASNAGADLKASVRMKIENQVLVVEDLSVAASRVWFFSPDEAMEPLEELVLQGEGVLSLSGMTFEVPRLRVFVPGLLELAAGFRGTLPALDYPEFHADVEGRILQTKDLMGRMRHLLPPFLQTVSLTGEIPFSGSVERTEGRTAVYGRGAAREVSLEERELGLDCVVAGGWSLKGEAPGSFEVFGDVSAEGTLRTEWVQVEAGRVAARFAGPWNRPVFERVRAEISRGGLLVDEKVIPLDGLVGEASLEMDEKDRVRLEGLVIQVAEVGSIRGTVSFRPSNPVRGIALLDTDPIHVDSVLRLLTEIGVIQEAPQGLSGKTSLHLHLENEKGRPELDFRATFSEFGFVFSGGEWIGSDGGGALGIHLVLEEGGPFDMDFSLDRGEMLAGTQYWAFKERPLSLRVRGKLGVQGTLRELCSELELAGLGRLKTVGGWVGREHGTWNYGGRVSLEEAHPAAWADILLVQPFLISHPDLEDLRADGRVAMDLLFSGKDGQVEILGTLGLEEVHVSYPAMGIHVEGLELDLPVRYRWGSNLVNSGGNTFDGWGRLTCRTCLYRSNQLAVDLAVSMKSNTLYSRGHLSFPVLGGRLVLSDAEVYEPFSRDVRTELRVVLRDLDLGEIRTEGAGMQGTLQGDFDSVRITTQRLDVEGILHGSFFGGRLSGEGFFVDRPFSSARVFGLETLRVHLLDLEPLSASLGAGRITGRLNLEVDGVQVAYGEPQSFVLTAESVPVRGVSQVMSMEAVDSLSVLGTGEGTSGLGTALFASFFNEFRYGKLGIQCSLNNDVFRLRGLIRDNGVEYLVRKPPLFGINVINGNPDNRISFRDMMQRLRRISGPGAG